MPGAGEAAEGEEAGIPSAGRLDSDDRWNDLQQPAHPGRIELQFRVLLAALDGGWRIEETVYLHPRWSDRGPRVYHFILRRWPQATPKLISIPEGADIDGDVRREGLCLLVGQ